MAPFVLEYKDGQRSVRQARKSPPLVMKTGDVQVREIGPLAWTYCEDGLPPDRHDEDKDWLFCIRWANAIKDVRLGQFEKAGRIHERDMFGANGIGWPVGTREGEVYAWAPVPDPPPMR